MNMIRSALSRVAWVGRTASMVLGLALVMALVVGVATAALAGTGIGAPFNLGKINTVNRISQLVGAPDNAMLRVDNNSAATNATALDLQVEPGHAPMRVNSSTQVPNLNADKLDGKDFRAFGAAEVIDGSGPLPREATFTSKGGTLIVTAYGSGFRSTGASLTYGPIGMEVLFDGQMAGAASIFANQRDVHQAFVPDPIVLENIPAGEHTIGLQALYGDGYCNVSGKEDPRYFCTSTDHADRFKVLVTEIPD